MLLVNFLNEKAWHDILFVILCGLMFFFMSWNGFIILSNCCCGCSVALFYTSLLLFTMDTYTRKDYQPTLFSFPSCSPKQKSKIMSFFFICKVTVSWQEMLVVKVYYLQKAVLNYLFSLLFMVKINWNMFGLGY